MRRSTFDGSLPWLAIFCTTLGILLLASTCSGQDRVFQIGRISHLALQGADTATTVYAIRTGTGREQNPLIRGVVSHSTAFVLVKASIAVTMDYSLRKGHNRHPRLTLAAVWTLTALYGAIVANNVRVIRGAR